MNDYGIAVMYTGIVNQFIPHKDSNTYANKLSDFLTEEFGIHALGAGSFGVVVDHPTDNTKVVKLSFHNESYFGKDMDSDGYLSFLLFCMRHPHENLPVIHAVHVDYANNTYAVVLERLTAYDWRTQGAINAFTVAENIPGLVSTLGGPTDLHGNNFMFRGKTVVLTDPYSRRYQNPPKEYLVSSYKDKKIHVEVTRPVVAATSEGTADKLKAQSGMLRNIALDDFDGVNQGMARPLLPVQQLRLCSAKRVVDVRRTGKFKAPAPTVALWADFARFENRLLANRPDVRPSAGWRALGADVRRVVGDSAGVQHRIQSVLEQGCRTRLQELRHYRNIGLITPAEYRKRKAKIYLEMFQGGK